MKTGARSGPSGDQNAWGYQRLSLSQHTNTQYSILYVYTLLGLLGISNRSNFHRCPTDCTSMFSFERGPNTEAVPNASEFFGNTPNISDKNVP
jgi:hypothetical protein